MANGKTVPIHNTGSSTFFIDDKSVQLNDILLASTIKKNLLSVSNFCSNNVVSLRFDKHHVYLKGLQEDEDVIGNIHEGLYQIHLKNKSSLSYEANICESTDLATWHKSLGHICERSTRKLLADNNLSSTNKSFICKSCIVSKHHRLSYNSNNLNSNFPLDLVYADVWGPTPCIAIPGRQILPLNCRRLYQIQLVVSA